MGNPGNPAGLAIPAFNASFAYFLVFMGELPLPLPIQLSIKATDTERRNDLPDLHDLLSPDEYLFFHHFPQSGPRLRSPCWSILQSGPGLREPGEYQRCGYSQEVGSGELSLTLESLQRSIR